MTKGGRSIGKTPLAVGVICREFEFQPDELKEYVREQRKMFESIKDKATTFEKWMAFKMTCTSSDAAAVIKWAERE